MKKWCRKVLKELERGKKAVDSFSLAEGEED